MPAGNEVRPQKWSDVIDIFDNGYYSAIWGTYLDDSGKSRKALGVRWNGNDNDDKGYPKLFNHPVWYVEPEFLSKMILLEILAEVSKNNAFEDTRHIITALSECKWED